MPQWDIKLRKQNERKQEVSKHLEIPLQATEPQSIQAAASIHSLFRFLEPQMQSSFTNEI